MISTGNLILEEVGNALEGGRRPRNPIKQARERQAAYSVVGSKELMVSTPAEVGSARSPRPTRPATSGASTASASTAAASSRSSRRASRPPGARRPPFRLPRLRRPSSRSITARTGAATATAGSRPSRRGSDANPAAAGLHRRTPTWPLAGPRPRRPPAQLLRLAGHVRPDLAGTRSPAAIRDAKTPGELKALDQQVYGRAHDPSVDAMSWEDLHRLREEYDRRGPRRRRACSPASATSRAATWNGASRLGPGRASGGWSTAA
jgi:hypothetical protein